MQTNPYRFFFPLGIAGAIFASSIWIPSFAIERGWISVPDWWSIFPRQLHAEVAVSLFLLPTLSGFLLTAVPRFTNSEPASKWFLGLIAVVQLCTFLLVAVEALWRPALLLTNILLAGFCVNAGLRGKPPLFFLWILSGLALGVMGSLGIFVASFLKESAWVDGCGRVLLNYGLVPQMVLGAGTMLVVPMSGSALRIQWKERMLALSRIEVILCIAIFNFSFIADAFLLSSIGNGFRFAVSFFWMIRYFHLFAVQQFHGAMAKGFWIASMGLLAGFLGMSLFPAFRPHFAHLYFIGGLSLFLMCVMGHVVTAHSSKPAHPIAPWLLWVMVSLIVASALTRVSAPFIPGRLISHLSYAAILFLVSWFFWIFGFGRRL